MVQYIKKRKNYVQKDNKTNTEVQKDNDIVKNETENCNKDDEVPEPKFGPKVNFPYQRIWARSVLILGVLFVVWYNSRNGKEISLARQKDILVQRGQSFECSESFAKELTEYPGCLPKKCGRIVSDKLVSQAETDTLLKIAYSGIDLGGSEGGASILDLQTGALSLGKKFINIYNLNEAKKIFNRADFAIYRVVKTKIQHAIAHHFGIDVSKIHLTNPTFFSRMTNAPAKTVHDEYWHPHVDKETYEAFHYTSLLYLSDYGRDFQGGRFIFIDKHGANATVEPRKGRVLMFTSGSENLHYVEKVTSGTRYALTVSFTCDSRFASSDPTFDKATKLSNKND